MSKLSDTYLYGFLVVAVLIIVGYVVAKPPQSESMKPWQESLLMKPKRQIMIGVTPNEISRELYMKKPMRELLSDPFADTVANVWLDNPYLGCNRAPAGPIDVTQDPTQILTMQEQSIEDEEQSTV